MTKILIVDDSDDNRAVVRDALEDEGYELLEAADGNDALKQIQAHVPDVVLLDIMMPGIDGFIVLKKIKGNPDTRHVQVIMLTAMNTDVQISECLDAGAVDYIGKPFSNMVLRARVRKAVRSPEDGAARAMPEPAATKRGRVIAFLGAKGGVGTTTVALNVAATLATQGKTVNFAELRADFSTAAPFFGRPSSLHFGSLLEMDPAEVHRADVQKQLTRGPIGFSALLSPPVESQSRSISAEHAEALVEGLAQLAECTILDVPSYPSGHTYAAMSHCDYVAIVTELEPLSWLSTKRWLKKLASWQIGGNQVGIIAVSRAPVTMSLDLEGFRKSLGGDLIGMVPADPDGCLAATRAGSPIVKYRSESIAAQLLASLADRMTLDHVPSLAF